MKIGIVGQGYVGTAVKTLFEKHYETNTFDLNGNCTHKTLNALVDDSEIIFVCVPTPMKKNGSCDISIVENVVKDINKIINCNKNNKIVAIKSTVPPGTTEKLDEECEYISVLFNRVMRIISSIGVSKLCNLNATPFNLPVIPPRVLPCLSATD